MIRAQFCHLGNPPEIDLPRSQYSSALADAEGLLWVDFQGESVDTSQDVLHNTFSFHPLAVEDAIYQTHIPKVDEWENYLYIALHALAYKPEIAEVELMELDVFLGPNYLVTHHDKAISALERVWNTFQSDERQRKMGADHLLYILVDELTVDFMRAVEEMDDEIDLIEDRVFAGADANVVQHIFNLKRATLHLRRSLAPMREVLNKLARDDYSMIDSRDRIYFRDVYDHFVRLHDIAESLRDLVSGVLDTYLSVVNNRMNEVMKTLTLITTLFMPISFIVGFFGMNFFQPVLASLVRWTGTSAFIFTMIFLSLTPALMYLWMRRRRWM